MIVSQAAARRKHVNRPVAWVIAACMGCSSTTSTTTYETGGRHSLPDAGSPNTGGFSNSAGGTSALNGSSPAVGGSSANGSNISTSVPTWIELYNNYFGPNTLGHCGQSRCHGSSQVHMFDSASSMCSVLEATTIPGTSSTIIGNGTAHLEWLLDWFNKGGDMPFDSITAPSNAVADITAWEKAGAVCP